MRAYYIILLAQCCLNTVIAQMQLQLQQVDDGINLIINMNEAYRNMFIDIYRSDDVFNEFEKIGQIAQNQNSGNDEIHVEFKDKKPIPNSNNYYKARIYDSIETNTEKLYYVQYNTIGYSIYNGEEQSIIFFDDVYNTGPYTLKLLSVTGTLLNEQLHNTEKSFIISNTNLQHGFYYFAIWNSNKKIIVQGKMYIP